MDNVKKRDRIFFISFIVSQPVIDIATGFTTRYVNSAVTPGSLIRALLLLFIVPYIWKELTSRKIVRALFVSSIGAVILTAMISLLMKEPFLLMQEAVFYMKALYYVAGIFFIILYLRKNLLSREQVNQAIVWMSLIIGGSYFLAYFTKTSFPSYPSGEIGFSGWFFSANELGVIIILSFASVLMIARNRPSVSAIASLFMLAGAGVLIGTKAAYVGIACLLGIAIIELLWTYKTKFFMSKHAIVYIILALLFFSTLPIAPMTENRAQHIEEANFTGGLHIDYLTNNKTVPMTNILSSRQDYLREIAADFTRAPMTRKLFGLGYSGDYVSHPKMIEMDFFELFFSFGIIGSIVLFVPLLYVGFLIITRTSLRPESWVLLGGLGLSLAISALAGHVLFAPSVMSYIVISAALLQPKVKRAARM